MSSSNTWYARRSSTACDTAHVGSAASPNVIARDGHACAQAVEDRRAYHVFEELNTYTAVVYLKKVNHPGPATPARP